jgi:hypothetical protein
MTETASDRSPGRSHSSPLLTRARPWTYAARPDSEAALHRLVALLRSGATRIALEGPPASGKTLLLRVLPARLGPTFASAYLPHPGLGPADVRAWLENFGEPFPADAGSTFEDLVLACARRGPGLVLLIDDANAMPEAVARAFGDLLARTAEALRIVVAGISGPSLDAIVAVLGGNAPRVRIGDPCVQPEPLAGGADPLAVSTSRIAAAPQTTRPPAPLPSISAGRQPLPVADATPAPRLADAAAGRPAAAGKQPEPDRPPRPPAYAHPAPPAVCEDRMPPTVRADPRRSLLRPLRALLLVPTRAAAIAGVALAVAAAFVLVGSDTRNDLPDVAATPPAPPAAVAEAAVPLHINARPWARIFVDDREFGVTPLGNVPIAPGLHRFRAELSDGRVVEREVHVEGVGQRVTFP